MKTPPVRLREGVDGPIRLVRAFNELRDFAIGSKIRRMLGGLVRETSGGTSLTVNAPAAVSAAGGNSQRMLVTSIFADYWQCSGPDGSVRVAKPWRLRRNPFDGNTITFTDELGTNYAVTYTYDGIDTSASVRRSVSIVTSGVATFTETQVVIPRMKVNFDYIDVITSENGTGVTDEDDLDLGITLIDLNTDGRAWARERRLGP